jgi:hypothetical protein
MAFGEGNQQQGDGRGDDLPPRGTTRWVIRRKAQVVSAVRSGRISLDDACEIYGLTSAEFQSWQSQIDRYGVKGLRVTRLQDYRSRRSGFDAAPKGS